MKTTASETMVNETVWSNGKVTKRFVTIPGTKRVEYFNGVTRREIGLQAARREQVRLQAKGYEPVRAETQAAA
jgi:hypothetical protein